MNRQPALYVITAATLWAVDGIILRPQLSTLPVTLVVVIESAIVAIILTPFFLRNLRALARLGAGDWLAFIGVSVLGGVVGTMVITKALFYVNYVNLSIVILIQKLQPVFALALAALFLKERLPGFFFFWSTTAMLGAYLMTFGLTPPNFQTGDETTLAALFAVIAALAFAASTILSKRALKNVGFGVATYLRFLIATLVILVIVIAAGQTSHVRDISPKQFAVFLVIAFSTGGPAVFLYYYGLKRVTASVATVCELAFPLSAVLLEYFVHGNVLSPPQWAGVVVLFLGIFQATRSNGNPPASEASRPDSPKPAEFNSKLRTAEG